MLHLLFFKLHSSSLFINRFQITKAMKSLFLILCIPALGIEPIANWPTIFNQNNSSNKSFANIIPSRVKNYYDYAESRLWHNNQAFNCYNNTCSACLHMNVPRVKLNNTGEHLFICISFKNH
jgi:hypothetical protein